MKKALIPMLAITIFAACDEPVVSDEYTANDRARLHNKVDVWLDSSNDNPDRPRPRRTDNWQPDSGSKKSNQAMAGGSFGVKCPLTENPYSVTYVGRSGDAIRTSFGGSQVLRRVRSASGEKYSNGEYTVWLKGNQASLTNYLGNTIQCRVVS